MPSRHFLIRLQASFSTLFGEVIEEPERSNDLPIKEGKAGPDIHRVYPYFARFFNRNLKNLIPGLDEFERFL